MDSNWMKSLSATLRKLDAKGAEDCKLEVGDKASEAEVAAVEAELGVRLPESFRRLLLEVAGKFEFYFTVPDGMELPEGLDFFCGEMSWDLDDLVRLEEDRQSWVREVFPNPEDEYDAVWHDKLAVFEYGNGDVLAIDLKAPDGAVVFLSHEGDDTHGAVLGDNFADFMERWTQLPLLPEPEVMEGLEDSLDVWNEWLEQGQDAKLKKLLKFFWLPSKRTEQPPLTPEMVQDAERTLGVKLPKTLIGILKVQNGGYIRYNTHASPEPTSWSNDHVSVDSISGIGQEGVLQNSSYYLQEWELPDGLVLLCGDGHTWVALDYRACGPEGEPPVVFADADDPHVVTLAPDFETFLYGLVEGGFRHIYGFAEVGDKVAELKQGVEKAYGITLQEQTYGTGFEAKHPEWKEESGRAVSIYLEPNTSHPHHPEYDWLLSLDIQKDKHPEAFAALFGPLNFPRGIVYQPIWE